MPRKGINKSYSSCVFDFMKTIELFPKWLYNFTFPLIMDDSLSSPHLCQTVVLCLFKFKHFDTCVMVSYGGFHLKFTYD